MVTLPRPQGAGSAGIVSLNFLADVEAALERLGGARHLIREAASRALDDMVRAGRDHGRQMARRRLDQPVPYTLQGMRYWRSTRENLTAWLFFADAQAEYLRWQEYGGVRRPRKKKIALPVTEVRTPEGNMPPNLLRSVVARVREERKRAALRKSASRRREQFAARAAIVRRELDRRNRVLAMAAAQKIRGPDGRLRTDPAVRAAQVQLRRRSARLERLLAKQQRMLTRRLDRAAKAEAKARSHGVFGPNDGIFLGAPNGKPLGYYERLGGSGKGRRVRPVFLLIDRARYRPRLNFGPDTEEFMRARLPGAIERGVRAAILRDIEKRTGRLEVRYRG